MEVTILTQEGKKELENRLAHFKKELRPAVIKRIGEARAFGDLSENAEYDAAKIEQAQVESEIAEMEAKLHNCKIIDKNKIDTTKVSIGCMVKVYDEDFNEEVEYRIIGSTESDPLKGLISNESPVGNALLGKRVGETVNVNTPAGINKLRILAIKA